MSDKKGIFSKLGKTVNEALDSVDEAFDKAGDAVKEVVKSAESKYVAISEINMSQIAKALNNIAADKEVKDFEVVSIVKNTEGRFEVLLFITKK